jgi:SAM-dependent methyltransferase
MMDTQAQVLRREYELRFKETEEYRNNVFRIHCSDFFSKYVDRTARVLDLGAGWGEFIRNIDAAHKFAMDLNPETGDRVSDGITFLHQDCSREWELESDTLDVIFTSNFLEHLPDKPSLQRTISEACRCLKPNGLIICVGPNIKDVPGAYWDFWDHHIPLTEMSVSELLRMNGFRIALSIRRFLPYSMSTGRTAPLFLVKLYLKMSFIWPLFGRQFLVIGRK